MRRAGEGHAICIAATLRTATKPKSSADKQLRPEVSNAAKPAPPQLPPDARGRPQRSDCSVRVAVGLLAVVADRGHTHTRTHTNAHAHTL